MSPTSDYAVAIRAFDYVAACMFGVAAALAAWQLVPDSICVLPCGFAGMTGAMTSSVRWACIAWWWVILGLLIQMLLHVTHRSLSGDV